MRTIRIFQTGDFKIDQIIELSPEASHHVGVVLRMQAPMPLTLFCGDNREFQARISEVRKKKVFVHIQNIYQVNRESSRAIHLAQALSKGERMEFVIQKGVELGMTSLTPIFTEHCAVKMDETRLAKKHQQWQAIAISACEQSGRNVVPEIHHPCSFDSYIQHTQSAMKILLHPEGDISWKDINLLKSHDDITLLIGPEGGLSQAEIASAKACQFKTLGLGPRILRTETAAIAALSVLQAIVGDL